MEFVAFVRHRHRVDHLTVGRRAGLHINDGERVGLREIGTKQQRIGEVANFTKQPGEPAWANDADMLAYLAFMKEHAADADPYDWLSVAGYYHAAWVVELLKRCGDQLTRDNLLTQMTHFKDFKVPMLLPDITINTAPDDYGDQENAFATVRWSGVGRNWWCRGGLSLV
jgi:hypothetical protein